MRSEHDNKMLGLTLYHLFGHAVIFSHLFCLCGVENKDCLGVMGHLLSESLALSLVFLSIQCCQPGRHVMCFQLARLTAEIFIHRPCSSIVFCNSTSAL